MCDCLVALGPSTADGVTLFAKNSDRPPDEAQRAVWSPPRRDTSLRATHIEIEPWPSETLACVLSKPDWCWGAEHGVNEAGVAIGNEAITTVLDPRPAAPALTGLDLVRVALERSATASDAVEWIVGAIARHGQGGTAHDPAGVAGAKAYWSSFPVADPNDAWVVETSGTTCAVERVHDVRAISNRTTIPEFDRIHRHPRQPVATLVDPRLHESQRLLASTPITVERLCAHLASHAADPVVIARAGAGATTVDVTTAQGGWSVCMHAHDAHGTLIETTTASMVAAVRDRGRSTLWLADGPPCTHPHERIEFADAASALPHLDG
jgi:hypothetical protein